MSGVLAVQCLENNSGHIRPPAGGLIFNIYVEIPTHTSNPDSTVPNGGITILVEVRGHDPNVTVSEQADATLIGVLGTAADTEVNFFN